MDRWIAAKKFHTNLVPRLDREITKAIQAQPKELSARFKETGTFGQAGWSIRKHHPLHDDD